MVLIQVTYKIIMDFNKLSKSSYKLHHIIITYGGFNEAKSALINSKSPKILGVINLSQIMLLHLKLKIHSIY